ncbi:hypothetical protein [Kamptonema sp. UHCC 0994]|uniref:hypothetical protein n=1 Tax=Kamptonema sp. UHCC 0994 TaxID=3031329 RepID=UPI0023B97CA3|nr:hypothetical protein [Kamptonema sp. UHCC 0994]MDF0554668.1 hypothetical protein [Kamptonema sp. UHCC 0994]
MTDIRSAIAWDSETGFLIQIFGRMLKLSQKPGFLEFLGRSQHANLFILRTIWSADGNSLTLFLKDTTYDDDPFFSGFMAVCDRVKGEEFFLAILYHEWFVIERSEVFEP